MTLECSLGAWWLTKFTSLATVLTKLAKNVWAPLLRYTFKQNFQMILPFFWNQPNMIKSSFNLFWQVVLD